jgi:hypothetical protein
MRVKTASLKKRIVFLFTLLSIFLAGFTQSRPLSYNNLDAHKFINEIPPASEWQRKVDNNITYVNQTLVNNTIYQFNGTELYENGGYYGTFTFDDDHNWQRNWSTIGSIGWIDSLEPTDDHKSVLNLSGNAINSMQTNFTSTVAGFVEFWLRYDGSAGFLSAILTNTLFAIDFQVSLQLINGKFYTVEGPRSMHGSQGSPVYTYLQNATPGTWYLIKLLFSSDRFRISINGTTGGHEYGDYYIYEPSISGVNSLILKTNMDASANSYFYIDSIWFSWDPLYSPDRLTQKYTTLKIDHGITEFSSFDLLDIKLNIQFYALQVSVGNDSVLALLNSFDQSRMGFNFNYSDPGFVNGMGNFSFEILDVKGNLSFFNTSKYFNVLVLDNNSLVEFKTYISLLKASFSYSCFNITSEITYCHSVNLFINYTADSADIEPIQLIVPNVTIADGTTIWHPTCWIFKQARIPMPITDEITSIDYSVLWSLQSARASTLLDSGDIDAGVAQVYLNGFMDNETHELVINKNDTNYIDKNSVLFVKLDKRDLSLNVHIVRNESGILVSTADVNVTEQNNLDKYLLNAEIMAVFDWDLITAIPGNKSLRIDVFIGGNWYPTYFPLDSNTSVKIEDLNGIIRNTTIYNLPNFIFPKGTNIFRVSIYYSNIDSRHNSIFKQSSESTEISSVFRFQSKIRAILDERVNPYLYLSSAATSTVDCFMLPGTSLRLEVMDIYNRPLGVNDLNVSITEENGAWQRFNYTNDLSFKNMTVQSGTVFQYNASAFSPISSSNGGMSIINAKLNDSSQTSNSRLLVTPRIIDTNVIDNRTRQAIDITLEMDLRQLFGSNFTMDGIAAISGAFWGAFVVDSSYNTLGQSPAYTGTLQVRNSHDNGWAMISDDLNLTSWMNFSTANFNNPPLAQLRTNFNLSCSELKQYADDSLRIFFKITGYYEGKYVVASSLSGVLGASHQSEMFGAILDHFGFDATMFKSDASASMFNRTSVVEYDEIELAYIYDFIPSIPTGPGSIDHARLSFDVSISNELVLGNPAIEILYFHQNGTSEQMQSDVMNFNVNRVPTITHDLDIRYVLPYGYNQPASNYSSLPLNLSVSVLNSLNNSNLIPAQNAKVLFYFQGSGDPVPVLVGEAYADSNGIAWITKDMTGNDLKFDRSGNVTITARVVANYGNSSRQLVDLKKVYNEPLFTEDYYGSSQLVVPVNVLKSPTTLTIQIQNVPTDATSLYASNEVYIRPVLIDTSILEMGRNPGKSGFWIFNLPVTISVNGSSRVVNSSIPAPFSFVNGGTYHISAAFAGDDVYLGVNTNSTSASRHITCKRFEFKDPSYPPELHVGDPFQISVICFDHLTNTVIAGLSVNITYFWSNTVVLVTSDSNGTAIFSGTIPLNAGGQNFTFSITHNDPSGIYERAIYSGYIGVKLYNLTIQPTLNMTGNSIPIREWLGIQVNVTNTATGLPVIGNIVNVTIFDASWIPLSFSENFMTGDVLPFKPLVAGTYYIAFTTRPGQEYRYTSLTINFTATVRPTIVSMVMTNNSLVPNNNFSITLYLHDALSGELLVGNQIQINRSVIGAILEQFIGYRTCSANVSEATFNWMPLRAGTFVFRFTFFGTAEYNASTLIESLIVDKRVVSLSMQLNDTEPRANDDLEFTVAACDLSTLNNDAIKNLTIRFVVFDGTYNYTVQTNRTSMADGTVRFGWRPTQSMAGKTVQVLAVSAETDAYAHAWTSFNLTISMIQTTCTLTANDTTQHYIGENVTFTYSLINEFNQFLFPATLNLSIVNIGTSQVLVEGIPLVYNFAFETFNRTFSAQGTYLVTISYAGIDDLLSGSTCSLSIYIEKRPVDFNLSSVPVLLHGDEPVLGSISIADGISGMPLGLYPITIYYLDPDMNVQILGTNNTDGNGRLELTWDVWTYFENVSITNLTLYFEAMETAPSASEP